MVTAAARPAARRSAAAASRLVPLAVYGALLAAHAPLLRLPYYWDEAGYFVPAALDLGRHGWWIPHATLANGHPPLVMAVLAAAWALAGFHPLVTRATMLVFAAGLVVGTARLGRELGATVVEAAAGAALLALTPLCFAQATLAQLDLPAAAWIVWALVARGRGRAAAYALLATAAVLTKETALIVPATLFAIDAAEHRGWRRLLPHAVPAAALGAWLAYYHAATGYWMGNAQFLGFNLTATLSLPRFTMALYLRAWQLVGYEGVILATVLAAWGWVRWRSRRASRARRAPRLARDAVAVIAAYVVFHAAVGGAVLARYLLPAVAIYWALIAPWIGRVPWPKVAMLACAGLLVAGWFWNPAYPFPYEDNLAYATFVRLQRQAAEYLLAHPPGRPVLTAWPATNELTDPDLGYVKRPLAVEPVENFSARALAAARPAAGQAVLLYSRQYRPRHDLLRWLPAWRRWRRRYFGYDPPLPAPAILARWHLHVVFRAAARGQWIMVAVAPGA